MSRHWRIVATLAAIGVAALAAPAQTRTVALWVLAVALTLAAVGFVLAALLWVALWLDRDEPGEVQDRGGHVRLAPRTDEQRARLTTLREDDAVRRQEGTT